MSYQVAISQPLGHAPSMQEIPQMQEGYPQLPDNQAEKQNGMPPNTWLDTEIWSSPYHILRI